MDLLTRSSIELQPELKEVRPCSDHTPDISRSGAMDGQGREAASFPSSRSTHAWLDPWAGISRNHSGGATAVLPVLDVGPHVESASRGLECPRRGIRRPQVHTFSKAFCNEGRASSCAPNFQAALQAPRQESGHRPGQLLHHLHGAFTPHTFQNTSVFDRSI